MLAEDEVDAAVGKREGFGDVEKAHFRRLGLEICVEPLTQRIAAGSELDTADFVTGHISLDDWSAGVNALQATDFRAGLMESFTKVVTDNAYEPGHTGLHIVRPIPAGPSG